MIQDCIVVEVYLGAAEIEYLRHTTAPHWESIFRGQFISTDAIHSIAVQPLKEAWP
jgi:hypothetical protein